ncbi:F0F1 ATP synthase subunit delta [Tessaracoccus rhinocerotis]|uniref:ATP synthase subunit delta n=1 Tax=Tessaracoccus rhinocerotis TaxID=1689449 RepID=A0A553JYA9_9ACTN|nr:F0F1 ATP synthase subunit delta [Tessaracoccus rhinocerotis]TRY17448.1 F0F1 ATP synthase subunit delta [Tessaracoccus rhinocerotis]
MSARDVATSSLDAKVDETQLDATASSELFAVVDLLDGQPPLRRSLSDPSAAGETRAALAERLFGSRISAAAMRVVSTVVATGGLTGRRLVETLERQGVRGLLRVAHAGGDLARVQEELHSFSNAVENDAELGDALRNRRYPLEARRRLVSDLTAGKVHSITGELLSRAAAGRVRNLPITVDTYLEIAAKLGNQQIAKVTVAKPLDESRTLRLRRALETQVGGPVALQIEVNPSVLGGMNVQLGDNIIESTVAGRLEQARRLLNSH